MKVDRIFFSPEKIDEQLILSEEESKHCIKVLRLKLGDEVVINDGKGYFYFTEIISDHHKKCKLKVKRTEQIQKSTSVYTHIAIAPTKNIDRLEWFLEKVTEIGIDEITPILCERSERKKIKNERLQKIIISAMKQSLKAHLPILNELTSYPDFIKKQSASKKYIAHCNNGTKNLTDIYNKGEDAIILIGPEGDFTEKEINLAKENNFQEISLGESRLRTETAGVVACNMIKILNEI